jgi:hypothetical protein
MRYNESNITKNGDMHVVGIAVTYFARKMYPVAVSRYEYSVIF